ncbi:hypothetical protein [Arenimonas daejeonensis]|uniref:hypothetical protein n=1 Tax=Arenimonas daejeonensis TaxID=370777 RepID=UPI0011BE7686|nr:hypothetical protein [Arenimonas daejeonensis]
MVNLYYFFGALAMLSGSLIFATAALKLAARPFAEPSKLIHFLALGFAGLMSVATLVIGACVLFKID